jgi:hypothetical protein
MVDLGEFFRRCGLDKDKVDTKRHETHHLRLRHMVIEKREIGQHFPNKPSDDFVIILRHCNGVTSPLTSENVGGCAFDGKVLVHGDNITGIVPNLSTVAGNLLRELSRHEILNRWDGWNTPLPIERTTRDNDQL